MNENAARRHRDERIAVIQRTWRDAARALDAVADTMVPGGQVRDTSRAVYVLGTQLHELGDRILEMNDIIFGVNHDPTAIVDDTKNER